MGVKPVKSIHKEIPDFVYKTSKENINSFIRGYMLGDGTNYPKRGFIRLYTHSKKLASGLSLLAFIVNKKSSCRKHKGYEICISEYKKRNPFWPLRHITKKLYRELRRKYSKEETTRILSNIRKNTRMKSCSKNKIINLLKIIKDKDLKKELNNILIQDVKVERVIYKRKVQYKGYVYDLEVPKTQNFLCGPHPIFAHNTMDAPLVLTSVILPSEVDDMVLGLDTVWKYPLEFYEAALEYKNPWDIKIEQMNHRLFKPEQYEGIGFTHDTSNINQGVTYSAYKLLPSMQEKLMGQMDIAEKLRAVDEVNVATLVIDKHFMKDIKGNLRKFSQQQFRCVKCNEKYRRPPLIGKCTKCGGKIIFTIAEGSVIKYVEPSLSLSEKYNLDPYLKQNLLLLKKRIESVFGKDKERQEGLGKWFG